MSRAQGPGVLGRRLVLATLAFGLGLALLVTAVSIAVSYQRMSQGADERLDEIASGFVPSLADSLWLVDAARAGLLMDGIAHLPGVVYVELDGHEGDHLVRGDPRAEAWVTRSYPLVYSQGGRYPLGTLTVVIGREQLLDRLEHQGLAAGIASALTATLGALLLFWLFRHWVTRHLKTMAAYLRDLTLQRLEVPLVLQGKATRSRPDELDEMVASFNRMREAMLQDLATRARYEEELANHRGRLEILVAERTAELEARSRELEEQANTDPLTGTASRRYFGELAEREIARHRRTGEPLSLMLLDIDHFKRINDTWGHAAGDSALRTFGHWCQQQLRELDVIARMGGEEFVALLPNADAEIARRIAERLRLGLSVLHVDAGTGHRLRFTVSIGVATYDAADGGLDGWLKRADDAMYRAKREGRDRVCVADPPA